MTPVHPISRALGLVQDPRLLWFMAEAGLALHNARQTDRAERVFRALTLLSAEEPLGWLGLAKVALDREDGREAARLATVGIRCTRQTRSTRSESHFVLGRAQALQGRLKDAVRSMERAVNADHKGVYAAFASEARESLQQFLDRRDNPV